MSKERELLEELKRSADMNTGGLDPDSAQTANDAYQQAAGGDALLDFMNAFAGSVMADPFFYVKTAGIVVLTVLILIYAIDLIVGS